LREANLKQSSRGGYRFAEKKLLNEGANMRNNSQDVIRVASESIKAGYTQIAQKAGLLFVTCLLDFKFVNEKERRLINFNVSRHCFTRCFAGSRNKVAIKTFR